MSRDAEIIGGPFELRPDGGMGLFSYDIKGGDDEPTKCAVVAIPVSLMQSAPRNRFAAEDIATRGRSALERALVSGRIPKRLTLSYAEHEFGQASGPLSRARKALGRFGEVLVLGHFSPVDWFVAVVSEPIAKRLVKLGNVLARPRRRSGSDPETGSIDG
jgi:hypothetical protein